MQLQNMTPVAAACRPSDPADPLGFRDRRLPRKGVASQQVQLPARAPAGRDLEAQIKRRVAATARRAARCRSGPKGCASSKHREIGESRILS
jgi:hypothetical protein